MIPMYFDATCMAEDQESHLFPDPNPRAATGQAHLPKPRFAYTSISSLVFR